MLFDWKSALLFVGAGQGLIVGLILLFEKTENYKRIFGLTTILFAIHLIEYSIFRSPNSFDKLVEFFGYRFPIRLCVGPLFLFYTIRLTQIKKLSFFAITFHFVPALVSLLLLIPFFILPHYTKILLLNSFVPFGNQYYDKLISLLWIVSIFSMFIYLFFSLIKIIKYRSRSAEHHSNEEKFWVLSFYRFTFLCVMVLVGYLFAVALRLFEALDTSMLYSIMSFILMTNLVILSIAVMKQKRIIPVEAMGPKKGFDVIRKVNKVTEEELFEMDAVVLGNSLFLNPNLTINDLASVLRIPSHIVSHRINKGHRKSFFTYINEYRIEHSKNLLSQTDAKILAVALDSGFSNKTSFHRTFKRIEGITPEAFRFKNRMLQ
nr:AraC family transcriptional regulator [uncultured Allomuricauda sp.]